MMAEAWRDRRGTFLGRDVWTGRALRDGHKSRTDPTLDRQLLFLRGEGAVRGASALPP